MRLIKMFGLAAIAVGAFMAFIGATSASAVTSLEEVVLCKNHEDPCLAANVLGEGSKIHADLVSGTTAKLLSTLGNVLCTESSSESEVQSGQNLAHGLLNKLGTRKLFNTCTRNGSACTVTEKNLPYLWLALLATDHVKYHIIVSEHGTGGKPGAEVKCGSFIECTFSANPDILFEYLLGSTDNILHVNTSLLLASGGLCPSSSIWQAEYLTTCLTSGGSSTNCWLAMHEKSVL